MVNVPETSDAGGNDLQADGTAVPPALVESAEIPEISVEVMGTCTRHHVGLTKGQRDKLGVEHGDAVEVFDEAGASIGIFTVGPCRVPPAEAGQKPQYLTVVGAGTSPVGVGSRVTIKKVDLRKGCDLKVKIVEAGDGYELKVPGFAAKALGAPLTGRWNVYGPKRITLRVGNKQADCEVAGGGSVIRISPRLVRELGIPEGLTQAHCYFENGVLTM